jgi:hypothetical protein
MSDQWPSSRVVYVALICASYAYVGFWFAMMVRAAGAGR